MSDKTDRIFTDGDMCRKEFPEVAAEPTSELPAIAQNDDYPRYTVSQCPSCGGEAIEQNGGGVKTHACRECKTGLNMLTNKRNYGKDWQRVRRWILDRDNHTCQECRSSENLHIHHIKNLVWHETTKEAHQPDNLITLCGSCHERFENETDHFQKI